MQAEVQRIVGMAVLLIRSSSANTYLYREQMMYLNSVEREPKDPRQGFTLLIIQSEVVLHKSACGMSIAMTDAISRLISNTYRPKNIHTKECNLSCH
jgi:hypothetical protein